ncbi:MAG: hypothetical protein R3181_11465 [Rubricoccaceae bacterium]|nr:hypothetical protein [Rubricoccaceae bacterium]
MTHRLLFALLILGLLVPIPSQAQAPALLSYQGVLERSGGTPLNDPVTLTFRLFDDPTGGLLVWEETQAGIPVADGLFAVTLGAVTPFESLEFYRPLWLEVEEAATGDVLGPRTALTATPYALSLVLPQVHNVRVGGTAFWINNTDLGDGIRGEAQGAGARGLYGHASAFLGDGIGVYGLSSGLAGTGVYGEGSTGVYGESDGSIGVGVQGEHLSTGAQGSLGSGGGVITAGVFGTVDPGTNRYAGFFDGDVSVTGRLDVNGDLNVSGTKNFRIDHPLDPANRYLFHFAVESSEVLNVYSGNVTTDAEGFSTVPLPDWFEAVNTDLRYQLTVLGTFAQAIVAEEVQDGRFVIQTDRPGVRVSWQVTGVRSDPGLLASPPAVESYKPAEARGTFVHPGVYEGPGR